MLPKNTTRLDRRAFEFRSKKKITALQAENVIADSRGSGITLVDSKCFASTENTPNFSVEKNKAPHVKR